MIKYLLLAFTSVQIIFAHAQSFELCRDKDELILSETAPYSLYYVNPSSKDCSQHTEESVCDAYSNCVWLIEECVPAAQTARLTSVFCNTIEDEANCDQLIDYGCEWKNDACNVIPPYGHEFVGNFSKDTILLAASNEKYIVQDANNKTIGFIANNVNSCPVITALVSNSNSNGALFSNPIAGNELSITLQQDYKNISVIIFDENGKAIHQSQNQQSRNIRIDAGNWTNGTYLLFLNLDGDVQTYHVIK